MSAQPITVAEMAERDSVEFALEDEIREILTKVDDSMSLAEIFAHSSLAEGRHSIAARLNAMARRGDLITQPCSTGRCYRLPKLVVTDEAPRARTIKGRVQAHLVKVGKPLSLRQIASNLALDRKAVTRALNALGRDGLVGKEPLDGHGRVAWHAEGGVSEIAQPEASVPSPTAEAIGPLFALASDGTLTLCVQDIELLMDETETQALLDYLAPWVMQRQAGKAKGVAA